MSAIIIDIGRNIMQPIYVRYKSIIIQSNLSKIWEKNLSTAAVKIINMRVYAVALSTIKARNLFKQSTYNSILPIIIIIRRYVHVHYASSLKKNLQVHRSNKQKSGNFI
jgi:hypothetical protein